MSTIDVVGPVHATSTAGERVAKIVNGDPEQGAAPPGERRGDFYSDPSEPLQAAVTCYGKGYKIDRHNHPGKVRPGYTGPPQEVLWIVEGRMLCDFWDSGGRHAGQVLVKSGDLLVIYSGSHAFEMIEPVKLVEVRQGPYDPENDKVRY